MAFKPWVYLFLLIVIIGLIAILQPNKEQEKLPIIGLVPISTTLLLLCNQKHKFL